MDSLFTCQPSLGSDYAHVWKRAREVDGAVERIDRMWREVRPYADSNFESEFSRHPYERAWELILGATLLRCGRRLIAKSPAGPDFKVEHDGLCVWVEATCPARGDGPDAIPIPPPDAMFDYPERQIVLRIRGAIDEKSRQYQSFLPRGLVGAGDAFVVAVNGMRFPFIAEDASSPAILKAVMPVGKPQLLVNQATGEMRGGRFAYQPTLIKQNGSAVATTCFLDPAFAHVSAVLFSEANFLMDANSEAANRYVTVIHNPLATNPLPSGWLGFGNEISFSIGEEVVTWSLVSPQSGGSG